MSGESLPYPVVKQGTGSVDNLPLVLSVGRNVDWSRGIGRIDARWICSMAWVESGSNQPTYLLQRWNGRQKRSVNMLSVHITGAKA